MTQDTTEANEPTETWTFKNKLGETFTCNSQASATKFLHDSDFTLVETSGLSEDGQLIADQAGSAEKDEPSTPASEPAGAPTAKTTPPTTTTSTSGSKTADDGTSTTAGKTGA